ncbi:MAG: biliverdin-producing heme oxygenase [Gemmatimonadota bacterium]
MKTHPTPNENERILLTSSLSQRLRSETRLAHTRAERSGIMRHVLRGNIDHPGYIAMLRNLESIYHALETGLVRHERHPALSFIDLHAVARHAAIVSDLDALSPVDWRAIPLTDAATDYVARLRDLDASLADRLLAHAYLRYLGDLSGGQLMRGVIARALSLSEERGTSGLAFYDFPAIGDTAAFKAAFRAALDAAPVVADDIVAETHFGYVLHERLFEELDTGTAA